ncbi:hypothetical protein HD553DRAFT_324370 [Filobasidium floriforme]|uniref:uncharacterized protein n=1 Tax=Filobasidium floriforme TaxID=5210 RepID=UPI001E8D76D8|nr:uncharacterized protein HD553DRAFT_324370 [Filobasidium floriforme]KAH8084268.1 hypothetical protein HD553DRAFT_324370 [Filobasidium floriforme]
MSGGRITRAQKEAQKKKQGASAAAAQQTNAEASGSGAQKRPAEDLVVIAPPTAARQTPPDCFRPINLIEWSAVFNIDEKMYVWDARCATVQHWWRKISKDQKKWETDKKGEFPTPSLDPSMKALRCSTGAYVVLPKEGPWAWPLQSWLGKEEDRKELPVKPTKEFEDLCKVGRTGEIDQQEINAYLAKFKGGWKLICPRCKEDFGETDVEGNDLPVYSGPNQLQIDFIADNEQSAKAIDESPLIIAARYGPVEICRTALPLTASSAFAACGPCKTAGHGCQLTVAEGWAFEIDDKSVPGVLRVAKTILQFTQNFWTRKAEREEAGEKAFKILRDIVCHRKTERAPVPAAPAAPVEGQAAPAAVVPVVNPTHDCMPVQEIVDRLVWPKKEKAANKGKQREE